MATNYNYFGNLVTSGLVLDLDAAKVASYPGTGTTWYNISGNNLTGSLVNGPTFTGIGKQAAIVFDGTNDYTVFPTSSLFSFTNANFSVGCWFKSTQNIQYAGFLGQISQPVIVSGWSLQLHQGKIQMWLDSVLYPTPLTYNDNNWHYALATISNISTGNLIIYVDGTQVYSTTVPNYTTNTSTYPLWVGGWTGGTSYLYNGSLSNVQIYNRILSATEITQNFNALRGRYGI
jgi:hypothetical protein